MANTKTFAEKTSADDTSVGFEYQYYYFLNAVLNLKVGQSAGLEILDDVHTQLNQDRNVLYQLKHTVKKTGAGDPKALTQLDSDLWKTLSNWSKVITDPAAGRGNVQAQVSFTEKTAFHLVSNKTHSTRNKFLTELIRFQHREVDFKKLCSVIDELKSASTNLAIADYIANVQSLPQVVAELFFDHLVFELGLDDIIGRIKQSILEKIIDSDKIDDTFSRLDSNIRLDNFIAVKAAEPIIISFGDFMLRYRKIFEDSRGRKLQYKKLRPQLPPNVFAQEFIRQLLKVEDLALHEEDIAIEYTTYKLQFAHYLQRWVQTGELVSDDVDELHDDVKTRWRAEYRVAYKDCKPSEILVAAQKMLTTLRREKYQLGITELNTQMSNGELYVLSDEYQIGWHKDWDK